MRERQMLITPQTKVGELLKTYPELEEALVSIAPAFRKLSNPVLLRTVARVTTLAQAARVGGVSVTELVQRLRRAVGQPDFETLSADTGSSGGSASVPDWFDPNKVTKSFDARPMIDAGEQPISRVLGDLDKLPAGEIYELLTPFKPAPLIDKAVSRGFKAYTRLVGSTEHRTYFGRI
jgi:hypothetical protein